MSNQYTYSPPFSEEQLFDCYVNKNMTQREIADKYHSSQKVVCEAMRKMGVKARPATKRTGQSMEQNNNWRGGRVLSPKKTPIGHRFLSAGRNNGYWMIRIPDHPHAGKNGYVFEHVVIALQWAGRSRLEKNECVHHVNFDKHDNSPENLCICDIEQHRWYHGNLENVTKELLKLGIISFSLEDGYYLEKGGDKNAEKEVDSC